MDSQFHGFGPFGYYELRTFQGMFPLLKVLIRVVPFFFPLYLVISSFSSLGLDAWKRLLIASTKCTL